VITDIKDSPRPPAPIDERIQISSLHCPTILKEHKGLAATHRICSEKLFRGTYGFWRRGTRSNITTIVKNSL